MGIGPMATDRLSMSTATSPTLAIIVKGYPRLSETFIAQEIRALEQRGFRVCLFSLRRPYDPISHPIHAEIEAPINYLPEYVADDIPRVLRAWWKMRAQPGYRRAWRTFIRDLRRDFTPNRMRRFAQALVLAHETPASVNHYYAHFMHTPASVGYYASAIVQKPWSLSAHAKDIWTIQDWEKREKIADAAWVVTCTSANAKHLRALENRSGKVALLYHGLDFSRFPRNGSPIAYRNGSDPQDPVRLVSVGRAVDKKGYTGLLEALATLPGAIQWHFTHIGGGELLRALKARAQTLGLTQRISWCGSLPQTEVLAHYRHADLFVLPSRISANGDRDGLPNVLMEAQSQCLACLSTDISGIPELIEHTQTGWLVPQNDITALGTALRQLIETPTLRETLAKAGEKRVREQFSLEGCIGQLAEKLSATTGPGTR